MGAKTMVRSLARPNEIVEEVHAIGNETLELLELKLLALDGHYEALLDELGVGDPLRLQPERQALLAGAMLGTGDPESATARYQQMLRDDDASVAGMLGLAKVHFDAAEYATTMAFVDSALAFEPNDFDAYRLRADISLETVAYEETKDAFQRSLDFKPRSLVARVGLSRSLIGSGDLETAKSKVRALINDDAGTVVGHYFIALIARLEGDNERTKSALRVVLGQHPNHLESRLLLVQTQLALGELEAPEFELAELLRKNPAADEYRTLLAEVYVRQGRSAKAGPTRRSRCCCRPLIGLTLIPVSTVH